MAVRMAASAISGFSARAKCVRKEPKAARCVGQCLFHMRFRTYRLTVSHYGELVGFSESFSVLPISDEFGEGDEDGFLFAELVGEAGDSGVG
jgi:hypothetical protein